jgi:hypothetical protein
MKRYFFDMRDGDDLAPDEEGVELRTVEAVQRPARSPIWLGMRSGATTRTERGSKCQSRSETKPGQ